jgi:hypothetical protein
MNTLNDGVFIPISMTRRHHHYRQRTSRLKIIHGHHQTYLAALEQANPIVAARVVQSYAFSTSKKHLSQPPNTNNHTAPPPSRPRKKQASLIRFWPFFAIFAGGTFLFDRMVKQRSGTGPKNEVLSSRPF